MNYKYNIEEVSATATGRWHEIFACFNPHELGQALEVAGTTRHVPCPFHGGKDGFRFFDDYQETGMSICNTCGVFTPYRLLQELNGWEFKETLQAVAEFLNLGESSFSSSHSSVRRTHPRHPRLRSSISEEQKEKRKKIIRKIWDDSLPLSAPEAEPARLYLARRGLSLKTFIEIPNLRFHPGLGYFDGEKKVGTFPTLVAKFINNQGKVLTLHRTYLTKDGRKAPVDETKKVLPSWSESICGGGIVLAKEGELKTARAVGVCEGIETALAVREVTGLPMIAATTAVLLEKLNLSKGKKVYIWADNDFSGRGNEAARKLAQRLREQDIHGRIFLPEFPEFFKKQKKGWDWADTLLYAPFLFPSI